MSSSVEQIKERLGIVEVVSSYVKLAKAGKNHKGLSPFSNEKTPSFYVSIDRDMYYCFSTNQGGDIFTFIEKMEGVDFAGALKILADRAGIELVSENKDVRDKRTRLYEILKKAENVYQLYIKQHNEVMSYLKDRGLMKESIEHFGIGFAKDEWQSLYEYLKKERYTERDLLDAGLIKKSERGDGEKRETRYYDTFRGRVMFPIHDSAGRAIAFSGRILPTIDDGKTGKYINSPETMLYNKSKILYGYSLAKGGIKKFNFSILVEGQIDVVMSHQAGYPNTVGILGTALTRDQLNLLNRLSKNIVMAFDADRAGISSAGKSATLALSMGMDVKVVKLPEGVDPADIIKEDKGKWKEAIKNSVHIIEFYIKRLRDAGYNDRKFKLKVQETVLPFIAQIKNAIDQNHFIQLVAREIGTSEEIIRSEIEKIENDTDKEIKKKTDVATDQSVGIYDKEEVLPSGEVSQRNSTEEKLVQIILWQELLKSPIIDIEALKDSLEAVLGKDRVKELLCVSENKKQQDIFKTELLYEEDRHLKEDVDELLRHLTYRMTKKELGETIEELKVAEAAGDEATSFRLLKKSKKIADKLKTFIGK